MSEEIRVKQELAATAGHWIYVSCHCLVKLGGGVTMERECDACGNRNLRYIHTLEHEADKRIIEVGIECARALVDPDDSVLPRLAENEVIRKERWRRIYRRPGRCVTTVDDLIARGKL